MEQMGKSSEATLNLDKYSNESWMDILKSFLKSVKVVMNEYVISISIHKNRCRDAWRNSYELEQQYDRFSHVFRQAHEIELLSKEAHNVLSTNRYEIFNSNVRILVALVLLYKIMINIIKMHSYIDQLFSKILEITNGNENNKNYLKLQDSIKELRNDFEIFRTGIILAISDLYKAEIVDASDDTIQDIVNRFNDKFQNLKQEDIQIARAILTTIESMKDI